MTKERSLLEHKGKFKDRREAKKYKILHDTEGLKGGGLFSKHVYTLPVYFGDMLVKQGKAIEHSPTIVKLYSLEGDIKYMTLGEYRKNKKEAVRKVIGGL